MILYTMMPQELIFQDTQQSFDGPKLVYMRGIPILVQENNQKQYEIVRVLSTDPNHYLLDQLIPGQTVSPQLFQTI
ncbi:YlzJ-like family protein [Bacillus kexueae]|uniref:YlzJ-like family protein n=1 Tax=Aeribacillus kexueae TaxID=2078952 RepID=UPI001FAEFF70|nr:YlzJ-like family protein [Bacillus kexueae]